MEAKDTVLETNIYNCHNTLEERLLEQAEVSFKAGIREVVEWIYEQIAFEAMLPEWQAKLKEWECK